jgi:phage terminase small subunit
MGGVGSGGAREGAGKRAKPEKRIDVEKTDDPIQFLLDVMNNPNADAELRVKAAEKAAKLKGSKGGYTGKKGEQKQAAEVAAAGRFKPSEPPKLVVNNKR